MNMKYLAILVGACLCLGGCIIETSSGNDNSGGSGGGDPGVGGGTTQGGGGSGGDTTMGGTAGMGGMGGSGGTAGAGGGEGCVTCAEFITPDANPNNLPTCDGQSTDLNNALVECICNGACMPDCADNICMTGDAPSDACQTCIADTAAGCGNEFNECSNDL
jgi:hypothetical protein